MHLGKRGIPLVLALAASTIAGAAAPAAGAGPAAAATPPPAAASTPSGQAAAPPAAYQVTLVTGDRVRVTPIAGGRPGVTVIPGPGRAGLSFHVQASRGPGQQAGLSVVPQDAAPLIAAGYLDPSLFDVSLLARAGDADGQRASLPVIETYRSPAAAAVGARALASVQGTPPAALLSSIGAVAAAVPKAAPGRWWAEITGASRANGFRPATGLGSGIARIWLDAPVLAADAVSNSQIGVPAAWHRGLKGNGVLVADLDTGYDPKHPDLAGRVAASKDFTGSTDGTADLNGHGTATASVIAGTSVKSGGRYAGVAPGARLLIGKVLDDFGKGLESQIIAGMQWAVKQHAKIVNMSLAGPPGDGSDPMSQAVGNLSRSSGTLFVVAAGNAGPTASSIGTPAVAGAALAVGAVDAHNGLAPFSSRGPRPGDDAIKPDITAPGVAITMARAAGSLLGTGDGFGGGPVNSFYTRASGTSFATPMVSGAAAILAQQHPDWTGAQLKSELMSTAAAPIRRITVFGQGDGRVDVARAVTQPVYARPGSVSDFVGWPHPHTVTKTVTYVNDGATARALTLSLPLRGPGGGIAGGVASLSASKLTVPAHGKATVKIAFRSGTARPGDYTGVLTAAGRGVRLRTAVGFDAAPQVFTLRVRILNRAGQAVPDNFLGTVQNTVTGFQPPMSFDPNSKWYTMRVPEGSYYLSALAVQPPAAHTSGTRAIVVEPSVAIRKDTSLTLRGSAAAPVVTTVDHPGAAPILQYLEIDQTIAATKLGDIYGAVPDGSNPPPGLFITPTPRVTGRPFLYTNHTSLADPAASPFGATVSPSPYEYNLFFTHGGAVPAAAGLVHHVRGASLARVRTAYDLPGTVPHGSTGQQANMPLAPVTVASFDAPVVIAPGGTAAQYYSARPGLKWANTFYINAGLFSPIEDAPATGYLPGHTYQASFGEAALHPAMTLTRTGDEARFSPALFSPSEPGHVDTDALNDLAGTRVHTTLSLGSTVLGTSDDLLPFFTLPVSQHALTLSETATHPRSWAALGTRAAVTWRFHTSHTASTVSSKLLDVAVSGPFDRHGTVPAGARVPLTVTVEHATRGVNAVSLAVSFDDGAHWQTVRLSRAGHHWTATVTSPAGAKFVSLRTSAADGAGNSVAATLTRAYGLR